MYKKVREKLKDYLDSSVHCLHVDYPTTFEEILIYS